MNAGRLAAWFVPDLALMVGISTLFALFFLFGGTTSLFSDSDTGWHILNGERIVATGSLPRADSFSFSKPGDSWVAWEWGADVLMGGVYRVAGLGGIALMYGLLIAASVWMWFRLNHAAEGNFLIGCLFFFPMLPTTMLHWVARPHLFSWLFLLGTVWFCERLPARLSWSHVLLMGIACAAWANLHASFFFGPLIAVIYAAGAWLRPLIWENPGRTRGRTYLLLALVAFAGTLVNPEGWRLHRHVATYILDSRLLDRISEFQSFDFHVAGALPVMFTLAICAGGGFAALGARKPERFLLTIVLTAAALHSVRALPLAALVLLPLANGSLTSVLARARGLTPGLERGLRAAMQYGDRLRRIEREFLGFAIVPFAALVIFVSIRSQAGFPAAEFPVAASQAIASLPENARILAPDFFGGYLIYRFQGHRKVFFDGRSDFYGEGFLERVSRLEDLRPGWRDEFNRWNFTYSLLPVDHRLIPALEANGWREIYRDRTAVLLTGRPRL